jgi:enamine deaminase RidA (YjgF/YER057c/UK114 family)
LEERLMDRNIINPWTWQDQFGFVQANHISGAEETILCAGQTSVDGDGNPVHAGDMTAQAIQAVDNLETVLAEAGFSLILQPHFNNVE